MSDFCDFESERRPVRKKQRFEEHVAPIPPNSEPRVLTKEITKLVSTHDNVKVITKLQSHGCKTAAPYLSKCRDCNERHCQVDQLNLQCRFMGFRKLIYKPGCRVASAGFPDPYEDSSEAHNLLWLPQSDCLPQALNVDIAKQIMAHGLNPLRTFIKEEEEDEFVDERSNKSNSRVWKPVLENVRDSCDACSTSLFNMHWTCTQCGFVYCVSCYNTWANQKFKAQTRRLFCKKSQPHHFKQFVLTQIIPGECVTKLLDCADKVCDAYGIVAINRDGKASLEHVDDVVRSKSVSPDCKRHPISGEKVPEGFGYLETCGDGCCLPTQLMILPHATSDTNVKLFQAKWRQGEPVVFKNAHTGLAKNMWTPTAFVKKFGTVKTDFINAITGEIVTGKTMKQFWDGFANVQKRLPDTKGYPMLLKLKDWPAGDDFAEICPEHFLNLEEVMPLREYTSRNGRLNLVSYLPISFLKPDLGPKLYIAYGSGVDLQKGTTNLHLDMADAANIMLYIAVPTDEKSNLHIPLIENAIRESGAEVDAIEKALANIENVGAIWHVYKADDSIAIRKLLTEVAAEPDSSCGQQSESDPIHDQSWYLDYTLRAKLKKDYSVRGYTIIQCLGDVVFIPAGAPHQVKNLNSCIKAALDFVSPEHVYECMKLSEEFRYLSTSHNNHEDKLQIKSIVYHAVKEAASVLQSTTTTTSLCISCETDINSSLEAEVGDSSSSSLRSESPMFSIVGDQDDWQMNIDNALATLDSVCENDKMSYATTSNASYSAVSNSGAGVDMEAQVMISPQTNNVYSNAHQNRGSGELEKENTTFGGAQNVQQCTYGDSDYHQNVNSRDLCDLTYSRLDSDIAPSATTQTTVHGSSDTENIGVEENHSYASNKQFQRKRGLKAKMNADVVNEIQHKLKLKEEKKEYDKQRHLDKKKSMKVKSKSVDRELEGWLSVLQEKGTLHENPNQRCDPPQ